MVLCRGSVTSADHVSTAALVQRLAWRLAPSCILCSRAAVCIRIPADEQSYNLLLFLWHRHLVYIMFQRRSLCSSFFFLLTLLLVAATNIGGILLLFACHVNFPNFTRIIIVGPWSMSKLWVKSWAGPAVIRVEERLKLRSYKAKLAPLKKAKLVTN